jgi:hypothetical protein
MPASAGSCFSTGTSAAPAAGNGGAHGQQQEDVGTAASAALSTFIQQAVKPEPTGDPEVLVAFSLGWQMAELYLPATWPRQLLEERATLPGLGALGARARAQVALDQVSGAIKQLSKAVTEHELPLPSTRAAAKVLSGGGTNKAFRKEIFQVHGALLVALTAASFKLGRAYGLGRALADTTRQPKDLTSVRDELDTYRVANLVAWINDLTTMFPPHAAHSVRESLENGAPGPTPNLPLRSGTRLGAASRRPHQVPAGRRRAGSVANRSSRTSQAATSVTSCGCCTAKGSGGARCSLARSTRPRCSSCRTTSSWHRKC